MSSECERKKNGIFRSQNANNWTWAEKSTRKVFKHFISLLFLFIFLFVELWTLWWKKNKAKAIKKNGQNGNSHKVHLQQNINVTLVTANCPDSFCWTFGVMIIGALTAEMYMILSILLDACAIHRISPSFHSIRRAWLLAVLSQQAECACLPPIRSIIKYNSKKDLQTNAHRHQKSRTCTE